jgi:hypothetical protein
MALFAYPCHKQIEQLIKLSDLLQRPLSKIPKFFDHESLLSHSLSIFLEATLKVPLPQEGVVKAEDSFF